MIWFPFVFFLCVKAFGSLPMVLTISQSLKHELTRLCWLLPPSPIHALVVSTKCCRKSGELLGVRRWGIDALQCFLHNSLPHAMQSLLNWMQREVIQVRHRQMLTYMHWKIDDMTFYGYVTQFHQKGKKMQTLHMGGAGSSMREN